MELFTRTGYNLTHESRYYWKENEQELLSLVRLGKRQKPTGIGLAALRLDGWVSIKAGSTEGVLVTKPFMFEGDKGVVNARVRGGCLRIAVQDSHGKPITGFSREDSAVFTGDDLHHRFRFAADVSVLKGRTVRLAFCLQNAQIYSFTVAERS